MLNYTKNVKITKIIEDCRSSVDLLNVPIGRTYRQRNEILHKPSHIGTKYIEQVLKITLFFEC